MARCIVTSGPGKFGNCTCDLQALPWDSKNKQIFAILADDICIANKQNPLSMSSNMATVMYTVTCSLVHLLITDYIKSYILAIHYWQKDNQELPSLCQ
jgi:hypothetical protein